MNYGGNDWLNRKYFSVQLRIWLNTILALYFQEYSGNFTTTRKPSCWKMFQHNLLRVLQKYSWHKLCSLCIAKYCSAYDLSLFDLYFLFGTLKKENFPVSFKEKVSLEKELFPYLLILNSGSINAKRSWKWDLLC